MHTSFYSAIMGTYSAAMTFWRICSDILKIRDRRRLCTLHGWATAAFGWSRAGYGLVIDPYRVVAGYPPLRVEANAVYISHHHFDHDCLEAVTLLPGGENPFTVETFSHLPRRLSGRSPGR